MSPHIKGRLLQLRNKAYDNEHVMVFVHGWGGDYLGTWGDYTVLCDDGRIAPVYDLVFWGYATGLIHPSPPLAELARRLNDLLDELGTRYRTITLVTHSKGGMVTLKALMERHKAWPSTPPHRIHRIVMFAPPTYNLYLSHLNVLALTTPELREMADYDRYSRAELAGLQGEIQAYLSQGFRTEAVRRFQEFYLDRLRIVHAEEDNIVDIDPLGHKTVFRLLLPSANTLAASTLSYSVIPGYGHMDLVKMARMSSAPARSLERFEDILWARIGSPLDLDTERRLPLLP
jgi:pimeloyl-ACP methyl ester carboxylesterase